MYLKSPSWVWTTQGSHNRGDIDVNMSCMDRALGAIDDQPEPFDQGICRGPDAVVHGSFGFSLWFLQWVFFGLRQGQLPKQDHQPDAGDQTGNEQDGGEDELGSIWWSEMHASQFREIMTGKD